MYLLWFLTILILVILVIILFQRSISLGDKNFGKIYDIVIVGGGIAGLTVARETLKENPQAQILILEKSDHLGGRIATDYFGEQPVELGALRVPLTNVTTMALAEELGISMRPFSTDLMGAYIAGAWYPADKIKDSFSGSLNPNEKLKEMIQTVTGVAPGVPFDINRKVKGIPLKDWGMFALLQQFYTREEIEWVAQTMNFETLMYMSDVSVPAFLNYFGLQEQTDFLHHATLYSKFKIPIRPESNFGNMNLFIRRSAESIPQVEMRFESKVKTALYKDGVWTVTYYNNLNSSLSNVQGKNLVLAIPSTFLKEIDINFPNDQIWDRLMNTVASKRLGRNYLKYPYKWWKAETGGYFDDTTNKMIWILDPTTPIIMSSYYDDPQFNFWAGLPASLIPLEAHKGVVRGLGYQDQYDSIPLPVEFKYKNWNTDYYAVEFFKPGSDPAEVQEASIQPFSDFPLFIASDAFAVKQGWIEGALVTAKKVATRLTSKK